MAVTIVRRCRSLLTTSGHTTLAICPDSIRMLAVATEVRIEGYAPNAPEALQNEAAIRFTGYLAQADYGTIRSESAGGREVEYHQNHATAFRNCGAEMLLTRYKKRRAG